MASDNGQFVFVVFLAYLSSSVMFCIWKKQKVVHGIKMHIIASLSKLGS